MRRMHVFADVRGRKLPAQPLGYALADLAQMLHRLNPKVLHPQTPAYRPQLEHCLVVSVHLPNSLHPRSPADRPQPDDCLLLLRVHLPTSLHPWNMAVLLGPVAPHGVTED